MDDLRVESGNAKMDLMDQDNSDRKGDRLESFDSDEGIEAMNDICSDMEESSRHDNDLFNCSDTPRDFSESFESLSTPRRARESMNESFDAEVPLKLQEGSWSPDSSSKMAESSNESDPSAVKEPQTRKPHGLTLKIDANASGVSGVWDSNFNDEHLLDSPVDSISNTSTTTSTGTKSKPSTQTEPTTDSSNSVNNSSIGSHNDFDKRQNIVLLKRLLSSQ